MDTEAFREAFAADDAAVPVAPAAGRPAETLELVDPEKQFGDTIAFILAAKSADPGLVISRIDSTSSGFRLRVRDGAAFRRAFANCAAFAGLELRTPVPPPRTFEVPLRVCASVPVERILDDLRNRFGPAVRNARRLHASTDGGVDKERPLPRVVVCVTGEDVAGRVASEPLFGALRARDGAPREVEEVAQCFRCFAWGHRAAACSARRRCIRCGATDHASSSCQRSREERRCFACGGDHVVTWRGCPRKRAFLNERRRSRQLAVRPPPRTFVQREVQADRSFAAAARAVVSRPAAAGRPAAASRSARSDLEPTRRPAAAPASFALDQDPTPRLVDAPPRVSTAQPSDDLRRAYEGLNEAEHQRREAREDKAALLSHSADQRFRSASRRLSRARRRVRRLQDEACPDARRDDNQPPPLPDYRTAVFVHTEPSPDAALLTAVQAGHEDPRSSFLEPGFLRSLSSRSPPRLGDLPAASAPDRPPAQPSSSSSSQLALQVSDLLDKARALARLCPDQAAAFRLLESINRTASALLRSSAAP